MKSESPRGGRRREWGAVPPGHSIQSTQQYGQTISMNRFEQNTKSDWCWKHSPGAHKGVAKKGDLLKNSNPHKPLRRLLFSLGWFLIFIAEGHYNPNENSVSSGKEVVWLERANGALAFKCVSRIKVTRKWIPERFQEVGGSWAQTSRYVWPSSGWVTGDGRPKLLGGRAVNTAPRWRLTGSESTHRVCIPALPSLSLGLLICKMEVMMTTHCVDVLWRSFEMINVNHLA